MSIIRSPRKQNFTAISNEVWSRNLSFRAIGLLTYLLSKPDHWEVSVAQLVKLSSTTAKPDGRDTIYGVLNELIEAGFVSRSANRVDGKMNGYDYAVHDISTKPAAQPTGSDKKHRKVAVKSKKVSDTPYPAQPYTALPYTAPPDTEMPYTVGSTQVKTILKANTDKRENTEGNRGFSSKSGRKKGPTPDEIEHVRARVREAKETLVPSPP